MRNVYEIIAEIEGWNRGDSDSFKQTGEVPIDGTFVFAARQKVINELKQAVKTLGKQ
jgi:hypothetical protein